MSGSTFVGRLAVMVLLTVSTAQAADKRVALVIGVGAYTTVPALRVAPNDARGLAASLQRLDFQVLSVIDPDRAELEGSVRRFGALARGADVAVVFYAGHAVEVGGRNWLLPTNTNPKNERDLRFEALDLDSVMEQFDGLSRVTIFFFDACRDNPFRIRFAAGTRAVGKEGGLAPVSPATGTLVAFATAPGSVALDGQGDHSPFTAALLALIEKPDLEIRQLLAQVRRAVRESTAGQQQPWELSTLEGEFYFVRRASVPAIAPAPAPASAISQRQDQVASTSEAEMLYWQSILDSTDPADLRAYLQRFPIGTFRDLAVNRLARLDGKIRLFGEQLLAAMAKTGDVKAAPYMTSWWKIDAESYMRAKPANALAIEPEAGRPFWWDNAPSVADAERQALEGCELTYHSACSLLASNGEVRATEPRSATRVSMPRIAYAGPFRSEMVPMTRSGDPPAALAAYSTMAEPKAMAIRGVGGRFFARGGSTAANAEANALAACNADGSVFPCFLYAVGNQVILSARRTEPLLPK